MTGETKARSGAGLGVDRAGGPVVDPTENVIALVEAAIKRLDDMRDASSDLQQARIAHLAELSKLRAEFSKEIRQLESDRLNAIRQVDVTAVKTEADRALAAIQTLAATTATNAETLRNALVNTASAIAKQTSDTVGQLIERIAALEKSSYEGVGRQRVADPQMEKLTEVVSTLAKNQATGSGKSEGIGAMWGWIVGGISLGILVLNFFNK